MSEIYWPPLDELKEAKWKLQGMLADVYVSAKIQSRTIEVTLDFLDETHLDKIQNSEMKLVGVDPNDADYVLAYFAIPHPYYNGKETPKPKTSGA